MMALGVGVWAQPGVVEFSAASYAVTEPAFDGSEASRSAAVEVTLMRHSGSEGRVSVVYATVGLDDESFARDAWGRIEGGRTMFVSRDYAASARPAISEASGVMVWEDGESGAKTIWVPVSADTTGELFQPSVANPIVEGTETLRVLLGTTSGGLEHGTVNTARIDILDAEAPANGAGVLHFSGPLFAVREDAGFVDVTLSRASGSTGAVAVVAESLPQVERQAIANPNPYSSAVAGVDYSPVLQRVEWADEDHSDKSIRVAIHDNSAIHFAPDSRGIKAVSLALHSPEGGALTSENKALVVIIDDEASDFDVWVDNEMGKKLRLYVPNQDTPLRGIIYFLPGTGGDWRSKTAIASHRVLANHYGFALAGQLANSFATPDPAGLGKFTNLMRAMALFSGRPELANAPIFFIGMSAGAYNAASSAFAVPEQTLGFVGHRGGDFPFPLGSGMSLVQSAVPGLIISGSLDGTTPAAGHYGSALQFRAQLGGSGRFSTAMDWNRGHDSAGGQGWSIAWLFFDELIRLRYPANELPGNLAGQRPQLRDIPIEQGWLVQMVDGFFDNARANPLAAANSLEIAPFAIVPEPDRHTMGWMPGPRAAIAYRALSSLYSPLFPSQAPFQSKLRIRSHSTSASSIATATAGSPILIEAEPRAFTTFDSIDFYYDTRWIGHRDSPPWSVNYTPDSTGFGLISAISNGDHRGAQAYAFEALLVTGSLPTPPPPLLKIQFPTAGTLQFEWPQQPYGLPSFLIQSAPHPAGPWSIIPFSPATDSQSIRIDAPDQYPAFFRTIHEN